MANNNVPTQVTNKDRRKRLDAFFKKIWNDGSFVHWVNPKTKRLNVKKVALEVLETTDASVFSKWAQSCRDDFNKRYEIWSEQSASEKTSSINNSEKIPSLITAESQYISWEFLDLQDLPEDSAGKVKTAVELIVAAALRNSLSAIQQLQKRVSKLEKEAERKDILMIDQAEEIERLNNIWRVQEEHFQKSIRNLHYD